MNYPIAIAFGFICLAIVAHLIGGIKQSLTVRPSLGMQESTGNVSPEQVERNWVQLMCAFQMVSIDLLAVAGVLYLLAFTEFFPASKTIAVAMSVFFALWAIAWLVQLASLKRQKKDYWLLGQWILWFVCSGLMYWGAQTI